MSQCAIRLCTLQVWIPQIFSCLGHACQLCLKNLHLKNVFLCQPSGYVSVKQHLVHCFSAVQFQSVTPCFVFFLFMLWGGAVSSITWCCVAYIQKVYIRVNSKTKICSVEETTSVIHTYIYMNNVFLHLICYFCVFPFRHVWRKRAQKNPSSLAENTCFRRGRRGTHIFPSPSEQSHSAVLAFVKSSLHISYRGFWLPLQCPTI